MIWHERYNLPVLIGYNETGLQPSDARCPFSWGCAPGWDETRRWRFAPVAAMAIGRGLTLPDTERSPSPLAAAAAPGA